MQLEIVVKGKAKNGKSRVALAISKALQSLGASVTLWDDEIMPIENWASPFIPEDLKVTIKTEMLPRDRMVQSVHVGNYRNPHDESWCPNTDDHCHVLDGTSFVGADGATGIVDVQCKACGRSGSFQVNDREVNW